MSAIRNTEVEKAREFYLFLYPDELDEDEGGPETIDGTKVLSIERDFKPTDRWEPDIYRMACNMLKTW